MSTLPAAISGVWAAFCQEKTFKPQEVCVNMPPNTKAGCTANVYNQIIPLNDSSAPDVMSWSLYCGLWMKRSLSVVMSYDGSDLCVFLPVEPECVLDDVFTFKTGGCRNALWSVNEHHYVKLKPMLSSFFFKHLFWASVCSRGWDIKLLVNVVKVFPDEKRVVNPFFHQCCLLRLPNTLELWEMFGSHESESILRSRQQNLTPHLFYCLHSIQPGDVQDHDRNARRILFVPTPPVLSDVTY